MQAELIGTEAAAQLAIREGARKRDICSGSMAAPIVLQNMTLNSLVVKGQAVELLWVHGHNES